MEVVAIYLRGRLEAHIHPPGYCRRPHNKSYGDAARNKPNAENRASRRTLSSAPEPTYNLQLLTGRLEGLSLCYGASRYSREIAVSLHAAARAYSASYSTRSWSSVTPFRLIAGHLRAMGRRGSPWKHHSQRNLNASGAVARIRGLRQRSLAACSCTSTNSVPQLLSLGGNPRKNRPRQAH